MTTDTARRPLPTDDFTPTLTTLAVTSTAAVSPAGVGTTALAAALAVGGATGGEATEGLGDLGEETLPPRPVRAVPPLPFAELLGRKGLRNLDRTTRLALVACQMALDSYPGSIGPGAGVVMGTSSGSVRSSGEYSLRTLQAERPYLVNPSLFPNTVMNCAAGQVAIRHGLHGVNATVAGGALAGIQALRYARNATRQGQAERLLVAGAEELSAQTGWGWQRSGALRPDFPLGEGAAALVVEPEEVAHAEGRPVLARVLAAEVGFAPRGRLFATLTTCIGRALDRSGVAPADVRSVALGATGQVGADRLELRAVRGALGTAGMPPTVDVRQAVGETFSATVTLQLAALVDTWRQRGAHPGEAALITALGHDGSVGCLVVRGPATSPAH
ncbi:3-oxoacyl-ACP synthase [Streptomyces kronopolitis]|uniref:3-oxoacyl-ACP synthase n=1 Tax=Streptomyces kronopolitis TaxID=1612435 RepID=A0ABQ2JY37_9ACTN|nr:beta-ketoacyl synthase N-terminal-like domain-containing protein [Streptomyces kronopolitis]GGN56400.1 3-oxoacyl-ACP synthase [Streptomyces kronopolitis]